MKAMSEYTTITQYQKAWLVRGLAALATMVLLMVLAPLVWAAISAAVGIASLLVLSIIGFATFQTLPVVLQKLENRFLQVRKAEACANPIEQLQNEMLNRAERLQTFRRALVKVGGQIESISEVLVECQHRDPTHILERQERALHRLQLFYSVNLGRLAKAQSALEEFRSTVERKASEWRISQVISDASELLDPHAKENLTQDLLTDSALRSVQERFYSVFAELDVQMSNLDGSAHNFVDDLSLEDIGALRLPVRTSSRRPT